MSRSASPFSILILTLALLGVGLVMVYSSSGARAGWERQRMLRSFDPALAEEMSWHSDSYLQRQAIWAAIGIAWLAFLVGMDTRALQRATPWFAALALLAMLLVLFTPLGVTVKGARRWLRLGPITIQPSEFAKPALVMLMAWLLSLKREKVRSFLGGFVPLAATVGVFLGVILMQRDLGTTVVLGSVVLGMWLLARLRPAHLVSMGVIAAPVLVYAILAYRFRMERLLAFLYPEKYALTTAYQLNQSLIAIGSGGLFGHGLGMGLQKYLFLSEAHTDFIFAVICEDLGFLGAICVVMLFLFWTLQGMRVALHAPDYFSCLTAAGMTLTVSISAFVNMMVATGLAPTKGLALPFISYGGSSLLGAMTCAGALIAIANQSAEMGAARDVLPVAA